MKRRAAIFDLDGTLLDTIEDLTDSMNAALAAYGFPEKTVGECRLLVGDGLATFIHRALPESRRDDPTFTAKLTAAMRAEYSRRCMIKTKPYPGIVAMLEALRARGISLSILSNKPQPATVDVVNRYFPGFPFRFVFGARENVAIKPDPAAALEIAAALSLPPAEILYLGDTNTDMQTAVAAGMFAVGALWGFRTENELLANGAHALVTRPEDVLSYF
ncbi:MAG: HAD family hydrolase [Candidatus Aminicenantes bacterium]|nr:HAD family hydrolase [Candidatus Aminicenantes bacterium]